MANSLLGQPPHEQVDPVLAAAAEPVELDGLFGVDAWAGDQKRQHTVPRFEVADEHAVGDRLRHVRLPPVIVGPEHGRPDPGEHFAGEDLFTNAAQQQAVGGAAAVHGLDLELFERPVPTVQAALRGHPVLFDAFQRQRSLLADQ
jgi:hypothetical protein